MRRRDGNPGRRGGDPVRLGDVLPEGLARLGPAGVWTEARLRKVWREAVGERVAVHAWVQRLRGRTLEVAVSDEAWATQLRYLASVVMARLNELAGESLVDEIVVRRARRAPN